MPYTVEFAQSVERHFRVLTARERTTILGAIGRQLHREPFKETRHRKPLRPNPVAPGSYVLGSFESSARWPARRVEWIGFSRQGGRVETYF